MCTWFEGVKTEIQTSLGSLEDAAKAMNDLIDEFNSTIDKIEKVWGFLSFNLNEWVGWKLKTWDVTKSTKKLLKIKKGYSVPSKKSVFNDMVYILVKFSPPATNTDKLLELLNLL